MASGEWGRSESKNYAIQPGISILCTNQLNGGRTRFGSRSLYFRRIAQPADKTRAHNTQN
jgi:hypothetical protein